MEQHRATFSEEMKNDIRRQNALSHQAHRQNLSMEDRANLRLLNARQQNSHRKREQAALANRPAIARLFNIDEFYQQSVTSHRYGSNIIIPNNNLNILLFV